MVIVMLALLLWMRAAMLKMTLADVKDKVLVLEVSPEIPNDTISFGKDVPQEMRDQIVTALLEIAEDEAFAEMLKFKPTPGTVLVEKDDSFL